MLHFTKKKKKHYACSAVIVAAGNASRMQGTDKILYPLGGLPLISHSLKLFQAHAYIQEIVVVTRADLIETITDICKSNGFSKVICVVEGGNSRAESVMNGLDQLKNAKYVAIHDGARPFVTEDIISSTVEQAAVYHAAAPAVPVKDTIKVARNHIVTDTPDRSTLFAIQTPQIFDYDLLRGALTKALQDKAPITDDCSAVEAIGMSVYLTDGSDENIKITTPTDLILAEAIWNRRHEG